MIVALIAWSLAANAFPQWYQDLSRSAYWAMGVAGAIGLFACVLLHELGHALVARRYDVPMRGITLFIFGGVAEMGGEPKHARAEGFVAVGGPAVTAGLIGVFYGIRFAPLPTAVMGVVEYLLLLNVVLLAFNAIPAFPLDGGRVLRAILWHFKGSLRKATQICSQIGLGFGAALIILGVLMLLVGNVLGAIWWVLIGMFLRYAAGMSYQQVLVRQVLRGETVGQLMTQQPITVSPQTTVQQFVHDYLYQHHHKLYPVTENGRLVGAITPEQIKPVPRDQWSDTTVEKVAEPYDSFMTVEPGMDAIDALSKINRSGRSRALVLEDGKLAGVISLKDLLGFLAMKLELESDAPESTIQSVRPMPEHA